ncbi:unnamed protein product [Urochloa decumbens]|uniref:Uncharacterized protein n=1 Tax=Urochloa decumbens TaxID=240449 RepID=A0ABC9BH47_9POAL
MVKAAVEAAAKGMISLSRARPAASAAAAAARTAPRWLHSTGGEVAGAGAASGAKAAGTVTRRVHSSTHKRDFETALFDHKLHTKQLLHEQNMRIIKLQGDFAITKAELEATKHDLKHEAINGKAGMVYGFGVAFFVMLVFDLTRVS